MTNKFDRIINRRGTDSLKYDFAVERGMPADTLPLWVADMDFPAPDCVLRELEERSCHGIFGYSDGGDSYYQALEGWMSRRFAWNIKREWLVKTPGVVFAIAAAIRALTGEGEGVLIQPPVYYPFSRCILSNNRRLVTNQLVYEQGRYSIDLADFEEKIVREQVKLFVLCSPHNPVGRVWTKDELAAMGEICLRHGVTVLSDEIHQDFVYPGATHTVFASLSPELARHTITCTAPSKTFNLAGLQVSNILIPDEKLRGAFQAEMRRTGYSQLNAMGIVACRAAYREGEPWLEELTAYLGQNIEFVRGFLRERIPPVKLVEPEGTYLLWLDCSAWGMEDQELDRFIAHKAGLWLDGGTMFGAGGEGFQRVNIACPRATLEQALIQLEQAAKTL